MSRPIRLLGLAVVAMALAACRLDVDVSTTVNPDGTGEVVVVGAVDKDVVDRVPGLAGSLVLGDATAAGWVAEGPTATEAGGLTVTLRHPFATVQEAANLINSLGSPFANIVFERSASDEEVAVAMTGTLTLPGGTWDAFGDQALITAAGGTPFAAQLDESGASPADSMSVELSVRLPGDVEQSNGDTRDGAVVWSAPLDGSSIDVSARSVLLAGGGGSGWAARLGTAALVLLIAWLIIGIVLVVLVGRAHAPGVAIDRYAGSTEGSGVLVEDRRLGDPLERLLDRCGGGVVDAVDLHQVGDRRPLQPGESAEVLDDPRRRVVGEPVHPVEQSQALRRDLLVEVLGVVLAVQRPCRRAQIEHLVVGQAIHLGERRRHRPLERDVVGDDELDLVLDVAVHLVELEAQQPRLDAELDDHRLDLLGDAVDHLAALHDGGDVAE